MSGKKEESIYAREDKLQVVKCCFMQFSMSKKIEMPWPNTRNCENVYKSSILFSQKQKRTLVLIALLGLFLWVHCKAS